MAGHELALCSCMLEGQVCMRDFSDQAETAPENLEGDFICQSFCFFSLITFIMFWTDSFENIT